MGEENMSEMEKISDELMKKVAGGTQAEADEWLAGVMKYYGVSTKEEAFAVMTEEQKAIYQLLFDSYSGSDKYENYYDELDRP